MSKTHGKPEEGMSCLCTWDDIDEETYCEYQTAPSMLWYPSKYSAEVVQELIDTQFKNYVDNVQKSDCARELRRLLTAGPPIWLADKNALPLSEGESHICKVWFSKDDREVTAQLQGAVTGEERQALWDNLKQFLEIAEAEKAKEEAAKEQADSAQ